MVSLLQGDFRLSGDPFNAVDVADGSGPSHRPGKKESLAGPDPTDHARVIGQEGAAVIRPAASPMTGSRLGGLSAAETERRHPVCSRRPAAERE